MSRLRSITHTDANVKHRERSLDEAHPLTHHSICLLRVAAVSLGRWRRRCPGLLLRAPPPHPALPSRVPPFQPINVSGQRPVGNPNALMPPPPILLECTFYWLRIIDEHRLTEADDSSRAHLLRPPVLPAAVEWLQVTTLLPHTQLFSGFGNTEA